MPKEKTDWVKFTIRLDPETSYLMHKYCKEPTPILREMIKAWVRGLVARSIKEQSQIEQAGEDIKW